MRRNYTLCNQWCRDRITTILKDGDTRDLEIPASYNMGFSDEDLNYWLKIASQKRKNLTEACFCRTETIKNINVRGQKNNGHIAKSDVERRKFLSIQIASRRVALNGWTKLQDMIKKEIDRRRPTIHTVTEIPVVKEDTVLKAVKIIKRNRDKRTTKPAQPRCETTLTSFEDLKMVKDLEARFRAQA